MAKLNQDIKTINKLKKMLTDAETGRAGIIERATNGKDFYENRHWTAEELALYKKKNITPITINHCFPVINTLSGLQRQSRRDIKVRHRKDASAHLAGVYTELIKHTTDVCYGHYVTSDCFKQGSIKGEDWLKCTIEDDGSPGGYISMGRVSAFNAFPDPTAQDYDINAKRKGGGFFIEREWVLKEEIQALYPDFKDDLVNPGLYEMTGDPDVDRLMEIFYGEEENAGADDIDFKKYKYRVHTIWWKEIKPALRWYDNKKGTSMLVCKKADMAKAKKSAKSARYDVKNTTKTVLHKSTMIGALLLDDKENPHGDKINFLPFIRFAPYFEDGYAFGVLENIINPQREENINRTQATRILNQTTNSGWIIKKALNKAKKRILEIFGSTPGLVIEESDYGDKVERITPKPLSIAHVTLGERSGQDIKEISQVNNELQGQNSGRAESGRALEIKRRQGQMGTEPVLDNLDWTLMLLGAMMVDYIRKTDVYSDSEIKAIIDESKLVDLDVLAVAEERFALSPEVTEPNEKLMAIMRPEDKMKVMQAREKYAGKLEDSWGEVVRLEAIEMFLEQLRSDEKGVYGIKVDLSPEAPTIKMANLIELSEIAEKYPGAIPVDVFVKNSGLTNKDEIAEDIKRSQQQQVMSQRQVA